MNSKFQDGFIFVIPSQFSLFLIYPFSIFLVKKFAVTFLGWKREQPRKCSTTAFLLFFCDYLFWIFINSYFLCMWWAGHAAERVAPAFRDDTKGSFPGQVVWASKVYLAFLRYKRLTAFTFGSVAVRSIGSDSRRLAIALTWCNINWLDWSTSHVLWRFQSDIVIGLVHLEQASLSFIGLFFCHRWNCGKKVVWLFLNHWTARSRWTYHYSLSSPTLSLLRF